MKNRDYRSRRNVCRDKNRRQPNFCDLSSAEVLRGHERPWRIRDRISEIENNCSQLDRTTESKRDRIPSCGLRRSRKNRFDVKNRNFRNCSQSDRSKGGW